MTQCVEASEPLRLKGNQLFKEKLYALAVNKYTEALKLNPKCYRSLSNRCQCHLLLKNTLKAIVDAEDLVEMKDDWAKGWYRLGTAYELNKDYAEASEAYLRAYQIDNTLEIAKTKYNRTRVQSETPMQIGDQMEAVRNAMNEKFLVQHVGSQMQKTEQLKQSQSQQEATQRIKKLNQTNEPWFMSWSTTPQISQSGERQYLIIIAGMQSQRILGHMSDGEPSLEETIAAIQSGMLNPLDFGAARKPKAIVFPYRMHTVFQGVKQFLDELNVMAILKTLQEAKEMAEETGNHYLGLNHLIHEQQTKNQ